MSRAFVDFARAADGIGANTVNGGSYQSLGKKCWCFVRQKLGYTAFWWLFRLAAAAFDHGGGDVLAAIILGWG